MVKKYFAKIASQHKEFKKSKSRIRNEDLAKITDRTKKNDIPYQTLLSALIHKYAKDELKLNL